MEQVGGVILSLCMVSLVAGICRMLLPKGSMGKSVTVITGVFILACCAIPFGRGIAFELPNMGDVFYSMATISIEDGVLLDAARQEVTAQVQAIAKEQGVLVCDVTVDCHSDQYTVWIDRVVIGVREKPGAKTEKLADLVNQQIDCQVSVEYNE